MKALITVYVQYMLFVRMYVHASFNVLVLSDCQQYLHMYCIACSIQVIHIRKVYFITLVVCVYVIVVSWARVICLICTPMLSGRICTPKLESRLARERGCTYQANHEGM